ncbi:hypothetical protein PCC21_008520 [Pectobacterium carotovorum subsp. carotovorum PCC21]|nr:hypothetical protein PCC21_008520 [Pectobacterium carotovorum subsp. carotovorum PCC21]
MVLCCAKDVPEDSAMMPSVKASRGPRDVAFATVLLFFIIVAISRRKTD